MIPGGYDISRLPLSVPPKDGEQLASWLTRWAHRYGLPVSHLLAEVGAGVTASPADRAERHLIRHVDLLAAAAGVDVLPPPPSSDGVAQALTSQVARYLNDYHAGKEVKPVRSRFCPSCLAESDGVWLQAWTAPLLVACTRHRRLLRRRCHLCRQARFTTSAWMTHDTPPWVCSEAAPGQHTPRTRYNICGQDLREVPAGKVDEDSARLQDWIVDLALRAHTDPEHPAGACGFETTARDLFDAALELVVEKPGGSIHLTRPDRAPQDLLFRLEAARDVLEQPGAVTAAGAATRHGLLHPGGSATPIGPDHVLTLRPRNRLLAAIRFASLSGHLPASSQLVFRTGSGHPRYPSPASPVTGGPVPGAAQLAWIPQQLWPGLLSPWVADHDYRGRAVASMLLAKVGSTRPWRLIAVDLGLPAAFATHPPNLVRHFKHIDAWPTVLRRLDELATDLEDSPPPIDYQARRWIAADHTVLVAAVNHARSILGPVHGWVSTHLLTELAWSVYTGGDLRLTVPTEGTLLNPDLYHDDEGIHVAALTDPALVRFLTVTADYLARATGHNPDEPLTWQPP